MDIVVMEDVQTHIDLSQIDIADVDHNGGSLSVQLTTTGSGVLLADNGGGVLVGGSGTASLTLNGSLVDLNAFLNDSSSVQYLQTTPNAFGNDYDSIIIVVT